MMLFKVATLVILGLAHNVLSQPLLISQDLDIADDTMSVGSYVREVRAAPDYHRTYENDGDGEIGYSRKKSGGGKKGYQHFDSFHKKGGDAYEFEKQDSYGQDDGDHHEQEGAHSEKKEKKAEKYQETPSEHHEGEYYEGEGQSESNGSSEAESDGNGGAESEGHDVSDYTLPEKYEYGTGDEYNF